MDAIDLPPIEDFQADLMEFEIEDTITKGGLNYSHLKISLLKSKQTDNPTEPKSKLITLFNCSVFILSAFSNPTKSFLDALPKRLPFLSIAYIEL